ncbi:MAG: ABC transporter ATP-binding protein [Gammaproteobacteria bacterium]|nr:ABC transporter ATP-binding protein [Gammaproteobacteria bacterium]
MKKLGYSWRQIAEIGLRHKREIVLGQLIALCATLLSVPIPLLMPLLVDEVLLGKPAAVVNTLKLLFPAAWHGPILFISAILALTIFLRFAVLGLGVWQMRQFTRIAKDVVYRIRTELIKRLQRVSMSEYETLGSGQVISHLVTDLDTVDAFLGTSISKLLIAVLSILGTAVVLLWMHWQLALFILLLNPLVVYLTIAMSRKVKTLKSRENRAYAEFQQVLSETMEAIQQIRAYNREHYYLGRVMNSAETIKNRAIAYAWKTDAANWLSFNFFLVGFDVFRSVSMLMVVFSDLSIGEMLAVFAYLWYMMGPMQEILGIQYSFQAADAALKRVNELFSLDWEPHYPHQADPFKDRTTAAVRLQEISFSYDKQTRVLDRVSLEIAAGEKVALVGASGGGKTTLVQILLGLYAPDEGMVYFNEAPVTQIGMDVVREHVVTVLQHPALFNDTLRMNLTLGRKLSDTEIWNALEIAQLRTFVEEMKNGLDTLLGQHGVRLSGGQRQRVACARMILAKPKVVILDEATSALDTDTEHKLHAALSEFLKDRTTIIIAHRLSAVKQANRVLVFDEGRIIEEGHHDALIRENGLYAKLYRS